MKRMIFHENASGDRGLIVLQEDLHKCLDDLFLQFLEISVSLIDFGNLFIQSIHQPDFFQAVAEDDENILIIPGFFNVLK